MKQEGSGKQQSIEKQGKPSMEVSSIFECLIGILF